MTKPIRSMPELIAALKARAHEIGIAYGTVDAIAGLPDRYTSKLFAPTPIKNLGPMSFEAILGALGVTVVLVEDRQQCERVSGRWTKRKRPLKTTASSSASIQNEVPCEMPVTPEIGRLIGNAAFMKTIAKLGGIGRSKRLSPRARRMIARKAARARWAKRAKKNISLPISGEGTTA